MTPRRPATAHRPEKAREPTSSSSSSLRRFVCIVVLLAIKISLQQAVASSASPSTVVGGSGGSGCIGQASPAGAQVAAPTVGRQAKKKATQTTSRNHLWRLQPHYYPNHHRWVVVRQNHHQFGSPSTRSSATAGAAAATTTTASQRLLLAMEALMVRGGGGGVSSGDREAGGSETFTAAGEDEGQTLLVVATPKPTKKTTATLTTIAAITGGSSKATKITTATAVTPIAQDGLHRRLKVTFYFGLWYALNIVYNIVNKKVLNVLPAPLLVGTIQLGIGTLYVFLLWWTRLRARPKAPPASQRALQWVGFYHALGQLSTVVALGAGPVSFTHTVKALEPLFSALVSALVVKKWMHPNVYLTLIPVILGVGYASLKEHAVSWVAFGFAMLSNLAFALRAVLSKTAMKSSSSISETNLSPANLYGVVTYYAFAISLPVAILGEAGSLSTLWSDALAKPGQSPAKLLSDLLLSGLFHYLNNEVMYLALDSVHPITLAVGNTMKRVFIIVASVLVFGNPVTAQAALGSAIALLGVLLYSLTTQYYETKQQTKQHQKS